MPKERTKLLFGFGVCVGALIPAASLLGRLDHPFLGLAPQYWSYLSAGISTALFIAVMRLVYLMKKRR